MYCDECQTTKIFTGCPFCLKVKIKEIEKELDFYKRELELIRER